MSFAVKKILDDAILRHGVREVTDTAFKKLIEPAIDELVKDLPKELTLLGEPLASVAKQYIEQAVDKLDSKVDPGGEDAKG